MTYIVYAPKLWNEVNVKEVLDAPFFSFWHLEPVFCKKRQKCPSQETGLGNKRPLEALNDTKLEPKWAWVNPLII